MMLHALLLALSLTTCNVYEGDSWCPSQPSGGYVSELTRNEGYGLPLPVLLSDYPFGEVITEARIQSAIEEHGYVILQSVGPVDITKGLKIPSSHFLEGSGMPHMPVLRVGPDVVLFDLDHNQESVRIDNLVMDGGLVIGTGH